MRRTASQGWWLRRRSAVEPVIGHLKADHGMRRCWLKGKTGDALHAVLCAVGFNIRWLMRAIMAKGICPLWQLFLRLIIAMQWLVFTDAKALQHPNQSKSQIDPTSRNLSSSLTG